MRYSTIAGCVQACGSYGDILPRNSFFYIPSRLESQRERRQKILVCCRLSVVFNRIRFCPYSFRSSDQLLLRRFPNKTNFGSRAFRSAALSVWNSLPYPARASPTLSCFKRALKSHYFRSSSHPPHYYSRLHPCLRFYFRHWRVINVHLYFYCDLYCPGRAEDDFATLA